jgi:hypothetical protein
MPNINPGVYASIEDNSDILVLNNSLIMGIVGEFEKGPDDKPMLINSKTFNQYFGNIENAPNKQSYISVIEVLKKSQGIQLINVSNTSKYAGAVVTSSAVTAFSTGVTTKDSFNFNPVITDEVLGSGDGSTANFSGTLVKYPVNSVTNIKYTIGSQLYTATISALGVITGTHITSGSVNLSTGVWNIIFDTPVDNSQNMTITYSWISDYLFTVIARSKKSWGNNIGIKIVASNSTDKTFQIAVYEKQADNTDKLLKTHEVSRNQFYKTGRGKNIFIDTIFTNESYVLYAINNPAIVSTTIPAITANIVYCAGGDDGITVTSSEYSTAIKTFEATDIKFDYFVGAGITEKTLIDDIAGVCDKRNKTAFIDAIDGDTATIVTWVNNTLNLDNMKVSCYLPTQYVSYNGNEYLCPASALAARQKGARFLGEGEPFMPGAGIGENRGSLSTIRQSRVYDDITDIPLLNAVGLNPIHYIEDVGNVIFSEFTLQRRESFTSYQHTVQTVLKMLVDIPKALRVLVFEQIDNALFSQIEAICVSYATQLLSFKGTIDTDISKFKVDFSDNDDITKDNQQVFVNIIFVPAGLTQEIRLRITYTSNQLFSELVG